MPNDLFQRALFAVCFLAILLLLSGCGKASKSAKTWKIAPEGIFATAFSNQYALIGSVNGHAELWNLKKKKLLQSWQHGESGSGGITAVAIAKNEQYAVTAQSDSLAWWQIRDGRILGSWSFDSVRSVSLSKDGQFALIGLSDRALYFALRYGKTVYSFDHHGAVTATDLSSDGRFALTGSRDRTVKLWKLKNGKNRYTWKHDSVIASVALGPKSRYALSNESLGKTRLWSIKTGKLRKSIGPDLMTLSSAAFSPNGKYIATGRTSQRIDLWKTKTGKNIKHWLPKKVSNWRPSASTVLALGFTRKGNALLSASSNGYVQLWKMR